MFEEDGERWGFREKGTDLCLYMKEKGLETGLVAGTFGPLLLPENREK
jgi:hypothetical protein